MKIGVFGGSFNPPHKMHHNIALQLLNKNYVDKIIYVPTGSKYMYKDNLLSDKNRLDMLKLMINNDKRCIVSDYELKNRVVYTYETLNYFKKCYPKDTIYFVCGTDNLSYIDKWEKGIEILENYKILVIRREAEDISSLLKKYKKYQDNIIITDVTPSTLSSTLIREKINNNEEISDYLDESVLKYIKENHLYDLSN